MVGAPIDNGILFINAEGIALTAINKSIWSQKVFDGMTKETDLFIETFCHLTWRFSLRFRFRANCSPGLLFWYKHPKKPCEQIETSPPSCKN